MYTVGWFEVSQILAHERSTYNRSVEQVYCTEYASLEVSSAYVPNNKPLLNSTTLRGFFLFFLPCL
jgi:hypothetical protein